MRKKLYYSIVSALAFVILSNTLTFASEPQSKEDSVSDNVLETVREEKSSTEDTGLESESVLRLLVPTKINFILDPYRIAGDQTLDSPEYSIINYSNVDVELEINELAYSFSDNGTFFASDHPLDFSREEEDKAVYMFLRRIANPFLNEMNELEESNAAQIENDDNDDFLIMDTNDGSSFKVRLKAANYDENGKFISLNEDSIFLFKIMGDIRIGRSAPWKAGDLSLHMVYSWVPVSETSDDAPTSGEPDVSVEPDTSDEPDIFDESDTSDEPNLSDENTPEDAVIDPDTDETNEEDAQNIVPTARPTDAPE